MKKTLFLTTVLISSFSILMSQISDESSSGTFVDERDEQEYKWIRIGEQVWMAENLKFYTEEGSWIYDNDASNSAIYGRLYNWKTAMEVCPASWHLPNNREWNQIGGSLSSNGFSALSGGFMQKTSFKGLGNLASFWSSTESSGIGSSISAYIYNLPKDSNSFAPVEFFKDNGYSVRCVKD